MKWKKGNHKLTALSAILVVLGVVLCILPFTFWVTGLLLIALGAFVLLLRFIGNENLRSCLILVVCAGLITLEILMGLISVQGQRDPAAQHSRAAIVLGAQVRGDVPSMALRSRLDAALEFMQENPTATVFVSGGKGDGENLPEAEAMYRYLCAHGADASRIVMEPESRTTLQNLRNTKALAVKMGISLDGLCIITGEFHMSRALFLASQFDIDAVSYSAHTRPWVFKMNYFLREIPAYLKAFLQTAG